ncbi:DsbA family oxidoreductase [Ruicaihuangia caeni]|uniref:DsbA family oxidoreductase n=1 Tax=Ruicaihuangia caeni TaxID=3042517 RepID=UPI00338FFD54
MSDQQHLPDNTPQSASSGPIKVDIWSDIACPWCYIGKRRFEKAVAEFGGEVDIEYHSFELAPDTPVDFEGSEVDFLAGHKGMAPDQVRGMLERVGGIAASEGLDYDWDALRHTKTLKAHQVLHLAKERGVQPQVKERLLKAYFEQGRHIGHDEELAELAAEAGLDRAEVLEALSDERYLPAVQADIDQARQYGINGVPFFVFEDKYGVSGAQESLTFKQVLDQVRAEKTGIAAAPETADGASR